MAKKGFIPFLFIFFIVFKSQSFSLSFFDKSENITASADSINYNTSMETIKASGNAVIIGKNNHIRGDIIFIDKRSKIISITGNASIENKDQSFSGDSVFFNYETGKGVIRNGKIFVNDLNFYITGQKIEKISEKTYVAHQASITSCDDPKKDWEFTAEKIKAEIDGYGYAYNMRLNTMERPLLYFPFLYFPVKTKRQSGLLIPSADYSDKYGLDYNQPLYLVLSDQADLTLYYNFIEKRSDRPGIELRYRHSKNSFTQIMYDQINNDPYTYNEQPFSTTDSTQKDRYWFRMKSGFLSDSGFKTAIDLDISSDPGYLTDFDKGYMGFDFTEKNFLKNFGRSIDPDDETKRTNRIFTSKYMGKNLFETEFLWMDDLIIKETGTTNQTVQNLPRISFYIPRTGYDLLPFQTALDSEYNYFYRINGEKGHRINFTPRIYLPLNIGSFLYLESGAYINETLWYTEDNEDEDNQKKHSFRQMYGFDIKSSSSLDRVYNIYGKNIEKIKHTFLPEINYHYIPKKNQADLPDFDEFDRIEKTNEIEFALTQTVTAKRIIPSKNPSEKKHDYFEFLRFRLSQIYDMADDTQNYSEEEKYSKGRFNPLEAYLKISFLQNINFEFTGEYDHYEYMMTKRNFALNASSSKGSRLRLEHRYTRDENKSGVISADLNISPVLSLHGSYEKIFMEDNIEKNDYEKQFGFNYLSQCWNAGIFYNEEEDEKKVFFLINLKNFGGISPGISESE
ncbi:MAG: LPS-assembly protein LptD [Desulfobacteraceae bacterium]|nr:LPS-assembly protein LptD [Desulfobacteraceae bacterium]